MARDLSRGDVWMYEFRRPDKERPVVVLTRDEAIPFLHSVMVAPITSTVRGLPSEVRVGADEGLKHQSTIKLDSVQTVEKERLRRFVGRLTPRRLGEVCRALAFAAGCSDGL